MTTRPNMTFSIVWTGLNVLSGGWAIHVLLTDPTQWAAGFLLGTAVTLIMSEWMIFGWRSMLADYGDIIDQYSNLVDELCDGIDKAA